MPSVNTSTDKRFTDRTQQGAGLIEFSIIALPLLFLGLGSVELSHWLYTRQAISLALLEAGRAAITDHNRPAAIINRFELALQPLFASPHPGQAQVKLQQALARRQQHTSDAPWRIEILSPSASAYQDFSDPKLRISGAGARAAINNHYLAEQDQHYRALGWNNGQGPQSGQTIYQANTVVLRLSWLHQPRLPWMTPLLQALGRPHGSYRQRALAHGYLPMTRQIALLMQSHPVQWEDDPSRKVIFRENTPISPATPPSLRDDSPSSSPSWTDAGNAQNTDTLPDNTSQSPGGPISESNTPPATTNPDTYGDVGVGPDDPACGITLCCA